MGQVEPLSILMQDDLLSLLYRQSGKICALQLAEYLHLLLQKAPGLRILEIGGGTAGTTVTVLNCLQSKQEHSEDLCIDKYDFTDISPAFFEKAKERLEPFTSFVNFKKLDIELNPSAQGFEEDSYDVVIATNCLHATRSLRTTLSNVKRLLRPGGKLALSEATGNLTNDTTLGSQMIFGTLPGWWLGAEDDGRTESPLLQRNQWNEVLKNNGFSGIDLQLSDNDNEVASTMILMISSRQQEQILTLPTVLIINHAIEETDSIPVTGAFQTMLDPISFSTDAVMDNKICIFAAEMNRPFLYDCCEAQFNQVTRMLKTAAGVVWITRGATMECSCPEASTIYGLARSARSENVALKLFTLDLDYSKPLDSLAVGQLISTIIQRNFAMAAQSSVEFEYSERKGTIYIPRLFDSSAPVEHVRKAHGNQALQLLPFNSPQRRLCLKIGQPGLLDTLQWEDQRSAPSDLGVDELELTNKAMGINFKDVMTLMGQLPGLPMVGGESSGIVTAIGANLSQKYKIGDRICALTETICANTLRVNANSCHIIPSNMSFETAASILVVYTTAYYSLLTVAKLQRNETILINSGAGGVGQAAIMLSQYVGATIFVTVGDNTKMKFIMETYGIPESHIFSSRAISFVGGIKRLTSGRGVDVVLNSLSGDALRETFDCVAPFGRFIEIGKRDFVTNGKLAMRTFLQNVSFTGVDLYQLCLEKPEVFQAVLQDCFSLLKNGSILPVSPVTIFSVSDIEIAYRQIQRGKHLGKIVLQVNDGCMVKMPSPPFSPQPFREDSSYLVVGGFGGIGREICRWLAKNKAKNIIAISRSGLTNPRSVEFAAELSAMPGVHFRGYACNVANESELQEVLRICNSDKIRGVIHGAMELKDTTLENMSYQDFKAAIDPKILGTLNLHRLLSAQLDFMILLSSVAGIIGSKGQGNYAAGSTFQDSFARYSASQGLKTISLDLGIVDSAGYASDNKDQIRLFSELVPVRLDEVLGLVDFARLMDSQSSESRQIIAGLSNHVADVSLDQVRIISDSKFSHLRRRRNRQSGIDQQTTWANNWSVELLRALSHEESARIICLALKDKLSNLLSIDTGEISESQSISRLGADSLVAVELRNWILLELKADVSMLDILESRPITDFALQVAKLSELVRLPGLSADATFQNQIPNTLPSIKHNSTERIWEIIDTYSTEISSWSLESILEVQSQKEVILLSGGSGLIGTVLLDILCSSDKVRKVYTLLRGDNGHDVLRSSFKKQGLDGRKLRNDKVEVLKYEMTDHFLGLGQDLYSSLSREITTVIHLAWKVDYVNPVNQFHDCFRGVVHLLRFCVLGRLKCFAFASTTLACSEEGIANTEIQELPLDDNPSVCFELGYAQSKYIVERITQIGTKHHGIPVRILRIGQVCGHSKFGYWSPTNMFPRVFKISGAMGVFPDVQAHIDWIPSDVTAYTILDIVTTAVKDEYSVCNIVNPWRVPWSILSNFLCNAGVLAPDYKTLSLAEWIAEMESRKTADTRSLALVPFLTTVEKSGNISRHFMTDKAKQVSPTFANCPPFNEDWMKLSIEIWRRDGFLS